jgi:flagellar basal-body rod modification protein FlgD
MNVNSLASNLAASTAPGTQAATQAANGTNNTFLTLLVTELKSQDPTAPMDATQMVAQMLSMNQLNQLISINQILQNTFGTPYNAAQSITGAH